MKGKRRSARLISKRAHPESATPQGPSSTQHRRRATFDLLPENVLLDIFAIRAYEDTDPWAWPWRWDRVAHVCRTWRSVVLSSPRRLKLFLLCTHGKPVVDILDHWPGFPTLTDYFYRDKMRSLTPEDEDNVVYALQHSSRIVQISFPVTPSLAAKLAIVLWGEDPFPMLTHLDLFCPKGEPEATLPKGFLNAPAPHLKYIRIEGAVVPSLPKILASTGDRELEELVITRIPEAGYYSPAALIPHISAMSHLRSLDIHYLPHTLHPQVAGRARSPPPLTGVVLPTLTAFQFQGASEDLEDLVSRFVAPRLRTVRISLQNQLIIDLTHLSLFLPRWTARIRQRDVQLNIRRGFGVSLKIRGEALLDLHVDCKPLDWQISALAQICTSLHAALSTIKGLEISFDDSPKGPPSAPEPGQDEPEPEQWLEFLQAFNVIEELRLEDPGASSRFCQVLCTLASSGEEVLSVLPVLRRLHLVVESVGRGSALVQALDPFVKARRLADRPVRVGYTARPSFRRG
ncbi:hypothetical protein BC834DRAFT_59262 [Gloeopeniophorella convolvens]|nr:hypothetical protein BC834DRAFT_59262 [Gloeopeniophorella convolvens]